MRPMGVSRQRVCCENLAKMDSMFNKPNAVPKEFAWPRLLACDGNELETHCRHVLESLGKEKGMLNRGHPGDLQTRGCRESGCLVAFFIKQGQRPFLIS
jgi:hypothetical protein